MVVDSTGFLHYPRVTVEDHCSARLRHYKAAACERKLCTHHHSELPNPREVDKFANLMIQEIPGASEEVSYYLKRQALRQRVSEVCYALASGKKVEELFDRSTQGGGGLQVTVYSYNEALGNVDCFLRDVDWSEIENPASKGNGVTQDNFRTALPIHEIIKQDSEFSVFDRLGIIPDSDQNKNDRV
jgi:hypothetical protein